MIEVRLYAYLAQYSQSRREKFEVQAVPGLTVRQVVVGEGVLAKAVYVSVVNGRCCGLDTELQDGDKLGLFPALGGG